MNSIFENYYYSHSEIIRELRVLTKTNLNSLPMYALCLGFTQTIEVETINLNFTEFNFLGNKSVFVASKNPENILIIGSGTGSNLISRELIIWTLKYIVFQFYQKNIEILEILKNSNIWLITTLNPEGAKMADARFIQSGIIDKKYSKNGRIVSLNCGFISPF